MKKPLAAAALLLLLLIAVWWYGQPPERRSLHPSQTIRALRHLRLRIPSPPPAAPPVPLKSPPPKAELLIRLNTRSWRADVEISDDRWKGLYPESYLPRPDEVDWPDLSTVDELDELLESQIEWRLRTLPNDAPERAEAFEALQRMLDHAEDEGILDDTPIWQRPVAEGPWALLHQAQVHRAAEMSAMVDETYIRPAQSEENVLPETTWLAEQMLEQYPDHPSADYARLLLLEATHLDLMGENSKPQHAVDTVVDVLEQSDDPLVKQAAMLAVVSLYPPSLDDADTTPMLQALDVEMESLPPDLANAVAQLALELALRGAPDEINTWMHHLKLDATHSANLEEDLVRLGLNTPTTWSLEILTRATGCHQQAPFPNPGFLTLQGSWNNGWRWTRTTMRNHDVEIPMPTAWLGCFEASTWTLAPPEPRLKLEIWNQQ